MQCYLRHYKLLFAKKLNSECFSFSLAVPVRGNIERTVDVSFCGKAQTGSAVDAY